MVETPEAFVVLLEENRSNWKPGYRFEQDVMVSLHGRDVPDPLIQIKTLVQQHKLPFVLEAVPGTQARHSDKVATLILFRATYVTPR